MPYTQNFARKSGVKSPKKMANQLIWASIFFGRCASTAYTSNWWAAQLTVGPPQGLGPAGGEPACPGPNATTRAGPIPTRRATAAQRSSRATTCCRSRGRCTRSRRPRREGSRRASARGAATAPASRSHVIGASLRSGDGGFGWRSRRTASPPLEPYFVSDYLPILVMAGVVVAFVFFSFVASQLLAPQRPNAAKQAPYECGIVPEQEPAERFPVK